MKISKIFILIIPVLFISGCIVENQTPSVAFRIAIDPEIVINMNQSEFEQNITALGFVYQFWNQSEDYDFYYHLQAWKILNENNNVSFRVFGGVGSKFLINQSGEFKGFNKFSNSPCIDRDITCIENKQKRVIEECDPVLEMLNISIDWDTVHWF